MNRIAIQAEELTLQAELDDCATTTRILAALPFEARANRWGDEIYFEIPVSAVLEDDARAEVEVGQVAYWPPGRALCLFFGPTPMSEDEQPRAASPVNVVGRIHGDPRALRNVRDGTRIKVRAA